MWSFRECEPAQQSKTMSERGQYGFKQLYTGQSDVENGQPTTPMRGYAPMDVACREPLPAGQLISLSL